MFKNMSFPLTVPNGTSNLVKDFSPVTWVLQLHTVWNQKKIGLLILLNCESASLTVFTTMCPKEQQTSDNLIVKDYCFIIEIFDKGLVKIILLPVIALSFPHFCPKLEQTLHIHQEQHSWHTCDTFVFKRCIKIPKNAMLYVRVVSDEPWNLSQYGRNQQDQNKTESMECSYLKLALFYSVLAEQFEGSTKKNI